MKRTTLSPSAGRWIVILAAALLPVSLSVPTARADIPDRDRVTRGVAPIHGMYQVVASSDPLFPMESGSEWFLDFNVGMAEGRTSGKVAVSLRRNPKVQVRILVWQVFPERGSLVIGNQFAEGARGAVALADWKISQSGSGLTFERDGQRVVLRRAHPNDY